MKTRFSLRKFFLITLIEGILAFIWMLLMPGDPESAMFLGFSKFRLMLLVVMIMLIAFAAVITYKAHKNSDWYERKTNRIKTFSQKDGNLTTTIVLTFSTFVYGVYFLYTAFTTTDLFIQGYFTRLSPFIFWITLICGQTLLFAFQDKGILKGYFQNHGISILVLFVILVSGMLMHTYLWDLQPEDWDINPVQSR